MAPRRWAQGALLALVLLSARGALARRDLQQFGFGGFGLGLVAPEPQPAPAPLPAPAPVPQPAPAPSGGCWVAATYYPAATCAVSTEPAVCGRGWEVYASESECCAPNAGFEAGCVAAAPGAAPAPGGDQAPLWAPAPVAFSPVEAPSYSGVTATRGPVPPEALAAAAPPGACGTLGEILAGVPQASRWLGLLRAAGLDSVLLSSRQMAATLLVPVNSAFEAPLALPGRPESRTMGELLDAAPELRSVLAGYHVVSGLWPASTLRRGASLPTAATLDKVNMLQLRVEPADFQLRGVSTSTTVLQADLAACRLAVVHLVDQILLPFDFAAAPLDAIDATRVAASSERPGRGG